MAIILEANYSKKLGLPAFSSHQYSLTVRAEVADLDQIKNESSRIHALLQTAVDREIQKFGYLPDGESAPKNGSHVDNGGAANSHRNGNTNGHQEQWKCSVKQKQLILKIVDEHRLDKSHVEKLAQELFGLGVRSLNKLQASALIEELLEQQQAKEVSQNGGRR